MDEAHLPTSEEMFTRAQRYLTRAYRDLSDAEDWLRSDWRPLGTPLTDEQGELRTRMRQEITSAKDAINRARP